MNKGKIQYLSELFNLLAGTMRELSTGELNVRGIFRRYRMLIRTLRQIASTAEALASSLEAEMAEEEERLCAL